MATFKICIRDENQRGFFPVYIRVIHNRKTAYIKTDKMVHKSNVVNKEIADAFLLKILSEKVIEYNTYLNKIDTEKMNVNEIVAFLKNIKKDICFSDYVRRYIRENKSVRETTLYSYKSALRSLETFMKTDKIMTSHLSSHSIQRWIEYVSQKTNRSADGYYHLLNKTFKEMMKEVNDYDNNIIILNHNPFANCKVPNTSKKIDKAIPIDVLRTIFNYKTNDEKFVFAIDVCKISFCLVGMNLVDLFNLKKSNVKNDIVAYERQKTSSKRKDKAYIEIKIPDIIKPTIEKYRDNTDSDLFFNFYQKRNHIHNLSIYINNSLFIIAGVLQYEKSLTYYSFRHSWATIAANDLKAGIEEVAFALNHVSAHEITRGYVKTDFSSIWDLNQRVLDYVFGENEVETKCDENAIVSTNEMQMKCNTNATTGANIEYSNLLQISVYYQAKKTVEITDIGFNSVDDILSKVQELADSYDIIKVHNLDTDKVFVIKR